MTKVVNAFCVFGEIFRAFAPSGIPEFILNNPELFLRTPMDPNNDFDSFWQTKFDYVINHTAFNELLSENNFYFSQNLYYLTGE